jgi:lipopolysaccharide transport system ATP-binding protein
MPQTVISVENLSKRYLVGHESAQRERYTALRDVIAREARNFARKATDVLHGRQIVQGDEIEEFWALKDVSFEVKRGEVLGIIGRNGAGKSTLLKILSRITEPTKGRVGIRGRVASLLEVGTGFHPELTGRENIYLNGAILGMTRAEIRRKFDEIVDFAGVEKFLDTPVKRYSSGMYVRLAFAVAAHLEPEILVVDEVLAVGDAEFQKKCLGKLSQVATGGRTVLFVSHNMTAIQALCAKCILLRNGRLASMSATAKVIDLYLSSNVDLARRAAQGDLSGLSRKGEGNLRFRSIAFVDQDRRTMTSPKSGEELNIRLEFLGNRTESRSARIGITFYDNMDMPLFICANEASLKEPLQIGSGDSIECRIPRLPLSAGRYKIGLFLERSGVIEDWLQETLVFDVLDSSYFGTARNVPLGWEGKTVLVHNEWRKIVAELKAPIYEA